MIWQSIILKNPLCIINLNQDKLAKCIYERLFDFYCEDEFSVDVIFTWQSPSLVKDGVYIGKRNCVIEKQLSALRTLCIKK